MQQSVQIAYLSMGSNIGKRKANLESGLSSLAHAGIKLGKISAIYETEPVGCADPSWYLNLAAEVETAMPPLELLHCCLEIEAAHGRIRSVPGAPRALDIDILLLGNCIFLDRELAIPHPRMTERRFVLEPLSEIAPDLVHPVLKRSVTWLLRSCRDGAIVRLYDPGVRE